jgi:hypothetical protein
MSMLTKQYKADSMQRMSTLDDTVLILLLETEIL